ncbi:response regulator [Paenibacillus thailandensis]|uniref:Response regulator n=1 Tax=Paenibacillus thailandensis TaxID=393250 RepID=A0ABW5QUK8_9BACL
MNIFLVEDEHWALAELVELLRIYEPAHSVYAFSNGEEAWQAAQKTRPGLVLTDITMPVMDGLELAERLHEMDPAIKKIIVSVHDQFEYARLGMKYGVIDFLVKPWKKEALYKAVDEALRQIREEARTSEEWLLGSLARMLQTPESPNHPRLRTFLDKTYHMLLLRADGAEGWSRFKESVPDLDGDMYRIDLDGRQRAILVGAADPDGGQAFRRAVAEWFELLRRELVPVHVGIASKPAGEPLYKTFGPLKERLESEMRFGLSSIVTAGANSPDADLSGAWDRVRMLETHYRNGELVKGEAVLVKLLDDLKGRRLKKRQLDLFLNDMLLSLKFKLQSRNGGVDVDSLPEHYRLPPDIYTYEELFQCLKHKFMSLYTADIGPARNQGNPKELIPKLLHLIHREYGTSLSLQRFAAEQHISLGYLSRMFKAHTGHTFSEYVTDYRIRKARELLADGVDRLHEVSRLVGYDDPKYFSLQFKKLVGESPMHYAKRMADQRRPPL